MLTVILAVTMTVPDLSAVERAYGDYLGYRVVERGQDCGMHRRSPATTTC
jgi:catechol-2,3-dioxygenase